jgi:transcriptional regulator with XRE-family HTH domain
MPDPGTLPPSVGFAVSMRLHMEQRGLTAATVARRFGHSPASIYQYTSGNAVPRAKYRPDLAAALGVPPDVIESWCSGHVVPPTPIPDALDETLAELRGVLRQMPAQRWPVVVDIVRQVGRL